MTCLASAAIGDKDQKKNAAVCFRESEVKNLNPSRFQRGPEKKSHRRGMFL